MQPKWNYFEQCLTLISRMMKVLVFMKHETHGIFIAYAFLSIRKLR